MKEISIQLNRFERSLKRLKEALSYNIENIDIALDATIQRFEFIFENAWKSIMVMARYMGLGECKSPRSCIKLAYKMGWIEDEEMWLSLLEARNLTTHTYNEDIAYRVYKIVKEKSYLFDKLLSKLREWED